MTTITQKQVSQIVANIATVRTDSDSKTALKYINMHTLQVLANNDIDLNAFERIVTEKQGDTYTIAQKSFRRATRLLHGIANNNFNVDFVPFEITASIINYAMFEGKVSGELARAFLSRLIILSEESQAKAGTKMKLKNRASKGVSTASAQSSSVKGMLRALGVNSTAKFSRETVADIESKIFKSALAIIQQQFKTK